MTRRDFLSPLYTPVMRKTSSRKVDQHSLDGRFIATHASARDGARAVDPTASANNNNICTSIKNGRTCLGYRWKYTPQPDLSGEEWIDHPFRPIKVSTHGRVEGVRGGKTFGSLRWTGYMSTYVGGKSHQVHRLIAEAFHPNPLDKPSVDHIDRCRTNNRSDNVRWVTHKENGSKDAPARP